MTATTSVGFLLLCVAIYVIACDLLRRPRMHALRTRLVLERNRNRFGQLRTKLVRLATAGELNPKSDLFAGVYQGITKLVRNPHAFEAAAEAVLTIPVPEELLQRGPRPTRVEGEIARDFATRIDLLCRDYSKIYAAGAWILDRLPSSDDMPPLWLGMLVARALRKRIGSIFEARERLERTARLAA